MTDNEYLIKLGESIAKRRKAARLTQSSLALSLGMDRQSISRMEQGTENIKTLTLYKLAKEFGINVFDFFDFEKTNMQS